MKDCKSFADVLSDLKSRGYESDFETESFCLYCGDLDMRLDPEEFKVDDIYKIDVNKSTESTTTIYAITSIAGAKGIVVERKTSCTIRSNMEMIKNSEL